LVTVALTAGGVSMAAGSAFAASASQQREVISLNSGATEDGACAQVSGQGARQKWIFLVDNLYGDTSLATLHAVFDDGTSLNNQPPTDTSNHTATWVVETAADAHITSVSADVTDANPDGATLTLTSCEQFGDPVTTTTASTTTTVLAEAATTTTVPAPTVPEAVAAAPVVAAPAVLTG
jgi:hypothetical protein